MSSFEEVLDQHEKFKQKIRYKQPPEVIFEPTIPPLRSPKQENLEKLKIEHTKFLRSPKNESMLPNERQVVAEATSRFALLMRGLASLMESRAAIEFKAYYEDHKQKFLTIAG